MLMSSLKYVDGTTDITRTVHFGKPSEHEKACYTAVSVFHCCLQGYFVHLVVEFMLTLVNFYLKDDCSYSVLICFGLQKSCPWLDI